MAIDVHIGVTPIDVYVGGCCFEVDFGPGGVRGRPAFGLVQPILERPFRPGERVPLFMTVVPEAYSAAESFVWADAAPTGDVTFNLFQFDDPFGTMTIAAGERFGSFTFLNAGALSERVPVSMALDGAQDPTLGNLYVSIIGGDNV